MTHTHWSAAGIWEAVATTSAQAMADSACHSIDSTTVRGHVSAAGAKGDSRAGLWPLAFHLTGGEAHDATAFDTLRTLAEDRNADLIADKGYDSDAIGQALIQDGLRPVIPPRSNDMSAVRWNKRVYR